MRFWPIRGRHKERIVTLMATLDDLKAKADALNQAIADMDTRLAAEEASESATTQATLDAAAAALDAAAAHIAGEAAVPPPPPPA